MICEFVAGFSSVTKVVELSFMKYSKEFVYEYFLMLYCLLMEHEE